MKLVHISGKTIANIGISRPMDDGEHILQQGVRHARHCKKGDVILILENETKLLVSSTMLVEASPVFNAMFGTNFKEGQNLSPDNPPEISLPDDDPDAMFLLCELLHSPDSWGYWLNYLPTSQVAKIIMRLGILAEKYL